MGLNLGVDFKGGTKMVVAFKGADPVDRELIRKAVTDTLQSVQGGTGTLQVEVQDFYAGGDEDNRRFMLYTESVTLLTEEQKEKIVAAVKAKFGEDSVVNPPAEGGDQFFLTFATEAPIEGRQADLAAIFHEQGLQRVSVESDKVRDLSMEFYKEVNLEKADAATPQSVLDQIEAEEAFKARVADFRTKNTDGSYTVKIEELSGKIEESVRALPDVGARFLAVESATSISPSVGSDLLNNGLLAVLYACIGILLYIALRFDFKYGPGAVAALVHDAIITIGVFAFTQVPFTLPIIAAILTIIGYSVNDTIVVFDRIRENSERLKGMPFERIINVSINETLSRTILTSGTTLLVVISIFLLGGGLIKDFAFALMVGIVVGTYSSIFIASPLLLYLHQTFARREKVAA
ncbi:MAG: protein translocase subunit SecF [Deltaproteobacteria bacterium]|nr:protein translocase subunit SecF [Deltaproteobacteria bacterium]